MRPIKNSVTRERLWSVGDECSWRVYREKKSLKSFIESSFSTKGDMLQQEKKKKKQKKNKSSQLTKQFHTHEFLKTHWKDIGYHSKIIKKKPCISLIHMLLQLIEETHLHQSF